MICTVMVTVVVEQSLLGLTRQSLYENTVLPAKAVGALQLTVLSGLTVAVPTPGCEKMTTVTGKPK